MEVEQPIERCEAMRRERAVRQPARLRLVGGRVGSCAEAQIIKAYSVVYWLVGHCLVAAA